MSEMTNLLANGSVILIFRIAHTADSWTAASAIFAGMILSFAFWSVL